MLSTDYNLTHGEDFDVQSSTTTFADGGAYRVEIPSAETPEAVARVLKAAEERGVPVHRISQGSGVFMLSNAELDEFASIGSAHSVEICLFARPTASWSTGAAAFADGGALFAGSCRGDSGLLAAMREIERAAQHGIRSVLISDIGLLAVASRARRSGQIPSDMIFKMSASYAVTNSATLQVITSLGADTVNMAGDASLSQLARMRSGSAVPFDIYVESPGHLGGFVRTWQATDLVRVAAPIYLKFGIRNAPDLYPSGLHHAAMATSLAGERVHRAEVAIEALRANGVTECSPTPGRPLGVPVTTSLP